MLDLMQDLTVKGNKYTKTRKGDIHIPNLKTNYQPV